ncbi:Protein CNPPD1 [Aphelenchoides fujianensis]|nr:Protein CNPPD1 [Aphelenchoides fujianensis]
MARPRSEAYKAIRQRLRRSLHYGPLRMNCLTIQLSELVINYFDRRSTYDFLDVDFAARISRDGCLDPCTLVAAMIYVERLRRNNPAAFQRSNPNDLYLSALIVATKFLNDCGVDEFVWQDEWAAAASTSVERINKLELRFLNDLGWDLHIMDAEYDAAVRSLERGVALKSAQLSGSLSYTDCNVLADDLRPFLGHIQRFVVMSLTVASAYLALWALSCGLFVGVAKMAEIVRQMPALEQKSADVATFCEMPPVDAGLDALSADCEQLAAEINRTAGELTDGTFARGFLFESLRTLRNHNGLFDKTDMIQTDGHEREEESSNQESCILQSTEFFFDHVQEVPIFVG